MLKTMELNQERCWLAEVDVVKSQQIQANFYLSKPVQLDQSENLVRGINKFWSTKKPSCRRRGKAHAQ